MTNSMAPLARLRLPVIAAPLFIIRTPALVLVARLEREYRAARRRLMAVEAVQEQ